MRLPLRNLVRSTALVAGLAIGASFAKAAMAQQWIGPLVAQYVDEEHACRIEVHGNGRFYRITAMGLEPGETVGLFITNDDMRPINRQVRADSNGVWAKMYMPYRWQRQSSEVGVTLAAERCELSVDFPWQTVTSSIDDRTQATLSMPRSLSLR